MIRISLKGLAKFMTGNSAKQRKVLRDYKYPDPEGHAQATYYREARDFIVSHHQSGHSPLWLPERAAILDTLASQSAGQTKVRLRNNARALREYANHFGKRTFKVLRDVNLGIEHAGVLVTFAPDLHIKEGEKEKIIRLDFTKEPPDDKTVKIITQAMFEAQATLGMGLPSAAVLYLDVPRGQTHKGARAGSRMRTEIEAACKNISALWDGI